MIAQPFVVVLDQEAGLLLVTLPLQCGRDRYLSPGTQYCKKNNWNNSQPFLRAFAKVSGPVGRERREGAILSGMY